MFQPQGQPGQLWRPYWWFFFQIFGLQCTSLYLRNLPVFKNSKNINRLLIVCYSLKGSLGSSGGCTDDYFSRFRAEIHYFMYKEPSCVKKHSKNINLLLILSYSLKGSPGSSGGCTDELFSIFLLKLFSLFLKNLPGLKNLKNINLFCSSYVKAMLWVVFRLINTFHYQLSLLAAVHIWYPAYG